MASTADQQLFLGPVPLASGVVLPVTVAFARYGQLAPDGRNAILVTHGYTASHFMLAHGEGVAEGSWAPLIGPGKPLDTDRYFIVCANMLGSSYGTTGPASLDPATGQPYGPDFPDITLSDIVDVQRRLLTHLGVRHLKAIVGPSYGGFQALQWAVDHPDWVSNIGVVVSAPFLADGEHLNLPKLLASLRADPNWNGGRYHDHHDRGGVTDTLRQLRAETLQSYGMDEVLAARGLAPAERATRIAAMADTWAHEFDANAMVTLLKAALKFDVRPALGRITADVLYVIASSDKLFPPNPQDLAALQTTRGQRPLHYVEMQTPFGHQASGPAHALWSGALQTLLDGR